MPVKIGTPINDFTFESKNINIFDPRYSTAVGLIKYAGQNFEDYNKISENSFIIKLKNFLKELTK